MKQRLRIRDISNLTGLDRETLRFYERKGLLPKPSRTVSGYREFDPDVIDRLKFIKFAQEVGFSLREISDLLSLGNSRPITKNGLKKIVDEKIKSLDSRIRALQAMRKLLQDLSQRAMRISGASNCPILSQFKNLEI